MNKHVGRSLRILWWFPLLKSIESFIFPNFFIDLLFLQTCFKKYFKKLELNLLKTGRVFTLKSIDLDHTLKEHVGVKFYFLVF